MPVLDNLKKFTEGSENTYQEGIRKINWQKKLIAKAKERIITAPENDILGAMLAQREGDLERQEAQWLKAVTITRAAIAMFKEYQFKDPEQMMGWSILRATSTTTV